MIHKLIELPYALNSLEPYISKETMEYHYLKHHKTYVDNLNNLIIGTKFENFNLEDIIKNSISGGIFNNAAQVWNHNFYFLGLTYNSSKIPIGKIGNLINRDFGNFENFKDLFSKSAISNFGSGWTWLIINEFGKLEIINTSNAENILTLDNKKALLTCDVWEHSYYIDYRNSRVKYLENFWNLVNWEKINNLI